MSLVFLYLGAARALQDEGYREEREKTAKELSGVYAEARGRIASLEEQDGILRILLNESRVWKYKKGDGDEAPGLPVSGLMVTMESGPGSGDFTGEEMKKKLGPGQLVLVRGEVQPFSEARNPGEFDFKAYYLSLGLDCRMYGEELTVLDGRKDPVLHGLRMGKLWAEGILYRLTGEEEAGIFAAAVMGDKEGIPKEINSLYQKNGIAHLLAISGMHMSVIGLFLYRILRKAGLGYGGAGLGGGVLVILYGILTGGTPSVERAVIMMVTAFAAGYLGRTYDLLCSAAFALFLLGLKSPLFLTQGGVQLSFGAVFAIGGVRPVLENWVGKGKPLAGTVSTAIAIQMVTLPVVLYHFYQLPLYGIFLNFLAIPLMDGVIYSAFGVIFLGSVWPALGIGAAGAGHYILSLYEFLCRGISELPYYNLTFGRPEPERIIAYGFLLAAVLGFFKIREEKNHEDPGEENKNEPEESEKKREFPHVLRIFLLFGVYGICILFFKPGPVKGLEALFLDVGQGDGILLRTGKYAVLVDGGSTSRKSLGEYTLEPCLESLGVPVIHYAFVSHGDTDHLSGVRYLLESSKDIRIENLMLPYQGKTNENIMILAELARKRRTKVMYLTAGDKILAGDLRITCLYPKTVDIPENANEESEVLRIDYRDCHMLFTGDMGEKEERRILERPESRLLEDINVLKTAHHGSKFSSCEAFLDALTPRWAVISYGENNSYGHPHKEVLERFKERRVEVYKTGEGGAIRLQTDGRKIRFSSFVDGE